MSDETKEVFWYCESVDHLRCIVPSSRGNKTYEVRRDRTNHKYVDESKTDWSCTCPSYEHHCGPHRKKRYCKHIEKVRSSSVFCGWQQFEDGDTPDYDENAMAHCPRCGRQAKIQEQGT